MKKFFSLILAVMMIATMSVTAFAAEGSDTIKTNGGSTSIDVSAIYSDSISTPDVISVDVAWGAMEFTYSVNGVKEWNPLTHEYTTNTTDAWAANGNTVTVTNHSNMAVKAELSFTAETAYTGITGSFGENATINLSTAVGTDKNAAPTGSATLTLDGTLAENVSSMTKVGTITVQIGKQ